MNNDWISGALKKARNTLQAVVYTPCELIVAAQAYAKDAIKLTVKADKCGHTSGEYRLDFLIQGHAEGKDYKIKITRDNQNRSIEVDTLIGGKMETLFKSNNGELDKGILEYINGAPPSGICVSQNDSLYLQMKRRLMQIFNHINEKAPKLVDIVYSSKISI